MKTPPSSQATTLQNSINSAIATNATYFTIPSGVYAFNSAIFDVVGAEDLVVDIQPDTEFWFVERV